MYSEYCKNIYCLIYFCADECRPDSQGRQIEIDGQQVGRGLLNVTDESLLSRLVAARLDLIVSERLLDESYRVSIIKRCWEDQLRLKSKYKQI